MSSETILQMRQVIAEKDVEITSVRGDITRVGQSAASAAPTEEQIAQLRDKRIEIIGQAFIAGNTADTAVIDREIKSAEKAVDAARTKSEAATAALGILHGRIEGLQHDKQQLVKQCSDVALDDLETRYASSLKRFADTVDTLRDLIGNLAALEKGIAFLKPGTAQHPRGPISSQLLEALRSEGLAVPPEFSKPRFPDMYFPGTVLQPLWVDESLEKLSAESTQKLDSELRELGF